MSDKKVVTKVSFSYSERPLVTILIDLCFSFVYSNEYTLPRSRPEG